MKRWHIHARIILDDLAYLAAILLLFATPSIACAGGTVVGNGGGIAEKNLTFAYQNLDHFIHICLAIPLCRVSPEESALLAKISDSLPKERKGSAGLVFGTVQNAPDFFKIAGVIRVAKTGDHVGDPIYINSELLYTPPNASQGRGQYRAVDVPLAVSILLHELGHHQGVKDHAELDRLGAKIQALLLRNSERSEFWNGEASVVTVQLNSVYNDDEKNHLNQLDQLLLEQGGDLYTLSDLVFKHLSCPNSLQAPKLGQAHQVRGLRIYNLHSERGVKFDEKTQTIVKPFRAWYIMSCQDGKESDHGDLRFQLVFKKTGSDSFHFLKDLTTSEQLSCTKHSEVCQ